MRIMFYIGSLKKGGAERVVSLLANSFISEHEVFILTTVNDSIEYTINDKITVISLDDGKHRNLISKNIFYLKQIKKVVKKYKPDVILSFLLEPSYRALLIKNSIKIPVIVSDRNDPKIEYSGFLNRVLMKFLYRKADGFVFQTKEAQNYFNKKIINRSTIIFNPVDDSFFNTKYLYDGSKEFINVGRLTNQKNQIMLIKAFEKVLIKHPDFKLSIYGSGDLEEKLLEYIKEKKLSKSIIIHKPVDNINTVLQNKYAFVLSSLYEGMPNALMEALTVGLPCISTDCPCGGSRELIESSENGILIENNNEEALTNSMIKLIEDKKLCEQLSKQAKKSMKSYSLENISNQWLHYIKEVLKNEKNN